MSATECVLDLLAGLLHGVARLLGLPLGLEIAVVGGVAHLLLDLALGFLRGVRRLVLGAHRSLLIPQNCPRDPWCPTPAPATRTTRKPTAFRSPDTPSNQ